MPSGPVGEATSRLTATDCRVEREAVRDLARDQEVVGQAGGRLVEGGGTNPIVTSVFLAPAGGSIW